jgi:hypothetical protein
MYFQVQDVSVLQFDPVRTFYEISVLIGPFGNLFVFGFAIVLMGFFVMRLRQQIWH